MKRLAAFLALVVLALAASGMTGFESRGNQLVRILVDDGSAVGGVLAGAPADHLNRVIDDATGEPWHRIDAMLVWPFVENRSSSAQWFFYPATDPTAGLAFTPFNAGQMWATYGGTDTTRAAVTSVGISSDPFGTGFGTGKVYFACPSSDSTEGVIGTSALGSWTDDVELYFRATYSIGDMKSWSAVGLWGNDPLNTGARGSAFNTQSNVWHGAYNTSLDGIACYLLASDSTGAGAIDTLRILAIGNTATDTVWTKVVLSPAIADDVSQLGVAVDIAFHVFGYDSIQYVVNGTEGTIDISGKNFGSPTIGASWRAVIQDEATALPFNAMTFTRAWAAIRPRL